jgi:hypothetical protein
LRTFKKRRHCTTSTAQPPSHRNSDNEPLSERREECEECEDDGGIYISKRDGFIACVTVPAMILAHIASLVYAKGSVRTRALRSSAAVAVDTGVRELYRRVNPLVLARAIKTATYTVLPTNPASLRTLVSETGDDHFPTMNPATLPATISTALGTVKTYFAERLSRRTRPAPSIPVAESIDDTIGPVSGFTGEFTNAHVDLAARLTAGNPATASYLAGFTGKFNDSAPMDAQAAARLFESIYCEDRYRI